MALALANLPIQVLDSELQFFANALEQAGAPAGMPQQGMGDEAGKVSLLAELLLRLTYARKASDLHLEPLSMQKEEYVRLRLRIDGQLHEYPATSHAVVPVAAHAIQTNRRVAHG